MSPRCFPFSLHVNAAGTHILLYTLVRGKFLVEKYSPVLKHHLVISQRQDVGFGSSLQSRPEGH